MAACEQTALPCLNVSRSDHLAPLLGFIGDQLAEFGGGVIGIGTPPWSCEPLLNLRIGETGIDPPVELVNNFGGCIFRRTNTIKGARLVAWHKSPTVGMSGRTAERVAVLTASARNLPALIYGIVERVVSKHNLHLSGH